MRFDFSEEQRQLAESVQRALRALPATKVSADDMQAVEPSFAAAGKALSDVGLFGLLVPEGSGGLGLGMVEAVAVAIETGRAAVPFPAIETLATMGAAASSRPDVLETVLAGDAFATAPIHGSFGPAGRPSGTGTFSVPFARQARYVAVPLDAGTTLLVEPGEDRGRPTDGIDLTYPVSELSIDREAAGNGILPARIDNVLGILAAAELVGAAGHCLDRAVQYLKERTQFGRIIGSFQALKHIAADCEVNLEGMKASLEYAAALYDRAARSGGANGDDADAETACRIAKSFCSTAALKIARDCIQLHGGIAFTWEYGLHLHFRRITRLANSYGTAYEHQDALATIAFANAAVYGGLAADPR